MKETTPEEVFKETSSHVTLSELYNEFMNKFPRKYVSWRIYSSFSTSKFSNKKSKGYIHLSNMRQNNIKIGLPEVGGNKSKLQTQKHKH
jgi:hypothetical protein